MAQIDPAEDGQLQLKKRARRRLVGAVALALTAVIVLPMVMDQEPKPISQDIQIRIPSTDIPTSRPAAANEPAVKTQTVKPQPLKSEAIPPKTLAPKAVETVKPEPVKPEPAPPPKATLPAKPAEAGAKADAQQEHAQWILQLGAYRDLANVRVLLARLKGLGYPSYTEKVQTAQGPRTRVRGGPFATRLAAEKAQARLKKIGAGGPPGGVVAQKQ